MVWTCCKNGDERYLTVEMVWTCCKNGDDRYLTVEMVWTCCKNGDERYPKMAWQARTQGKKPRGRPWWTWEEGVQKILKATGTDWNGVQAICRDRDRWEALCKSSTPTGRRSSIKWSEDWPKWVYGFLYWNMGSLWFYVWLANCWFWLVQ